MSIINDQLAAVIEKRAGMSVDEIRRAGTDKIHRAIELKTGWKLRFGFEPGLVSTGNVLIDAGRIIWPEEE